MHLGFDDICEVKGMHEDVVLSILRMKLLASQMHLILSDMLTHCYWHFANSQIVEYIVE